MRNGSLVVVVVGTLLLVGCSGSKRVSPFPTAAKLVEIAEMPPASSALEDRKAADVETWNLAGPFPSSVEATPRTNGTAWDALLSEAIAGSPKARMTEPLGCVARELGLFAIAHKAHPVDDLREFVAARCGSPSSHVQTSSQTFDEVGAGTADEELLAAARENLVAEVKQLVADGEPFDVGIWFGKKDGHAVVMLAVAVRYAELAPVANVPGADGIVSIQGTALTEAAHVGAYVTRGAFGAEPCAPDANVAPPAFSLTCKVDPADASAWIDVGVTPHGRILSRSVLSVLVFPSGKPGNVYRRPSLPVAHAATPGVSLETGFVDALNTLREHAKLTRINDAPAQSAIAKRLAPHYFAHGDDAGADRIALGIMAGWDVEGVVRYGRFSSASLANTDDPGRLLASLVGHAMGRTVLLDPEIAYVAIGTVASSTREVIGALIGSYSLYDAQVHEIRIGNTLPRLARIRKAAGKPPAVRVRGLETLALEAASAIENGVPPKKVLQAFMQKTAQIKKGAVYGLIVETESLRDFTLPADLAGAQTLEYDLAVAYYKNPGEPWGRYVLLFVFPGGQPA